MSGNPSLTAAASSRGLGIWRTVIILYSSWKTVLMNVAFVVGYYLVFYSVIVYANVGFFLLTVPSYLLALLVLTSSCSATLAVSYLTVARRRGSLLGVAQSPTGVALGALVASCSCTIPLLAPALYFIGLNALEVSGVISFLASYQTAILYAIILFNLLSIYYYLRLLSRSGIARRLTLAAPGGAVGSVAHDTR